MFNLYTLYNAYIHKNTDANKQKILAYYATAYFSHSLFWVIFQSQTKNRATSEWKTLEN